MATVTFNSSAQSSASMETKAAGLDAVTLIQKALNNDEISLPSYTKTITVQFADTTPNNGLGHTNGSRTSTPTILLRSDLTAQEVQQALGHELYHLEAPGISGGPAGAPGAKFPGTSISLHDLISINPTGVDISGNSIFGGMYRQTIQRELSYLLSPLLRFKQEGLRER